MLWRTASDLETSGVLTDVRQLWSFLNTLTDVFFNQSSFEVLELMPQEYLQHFVKICELSRIFYETLLKLTKCV